MADTRQRLIDGTIETIRQHGIAGTTARSIAATAGVTQALVFYHFGSVHDLLQAACLALTQDRLPLLEDRLARVTSLDDLVALHTDEHARGGLRVLAQLMAGAQGNPQLTAATATALRLWVTPIQATLERVLASSPVADHLDIGGLATALCAGFIGVELVNGIDPTGGTTARSTLHHLATLAR